MPLYKILATDNSYTSAVFEADDPNTVLRIVRQLQCQEADVLEDNVYSFSVKMGDAGTWTIFQRDHEVGWERAVGSDRRKSARPHKALTLRISRHSGGSFE